MIDKKRIVEKSGMLGFEKHEVENETAAYKSIF